MFVYTSESPSQEQLQEATRKGARLLDKMIPGWHRHMRPERLVMSSPSLCALGQLFGHDVELSIAKEMYPKAWAKHRKGEGSGYGIGVGMITEWVNKEIACSPEMCTELNEERNFLRMTCAGYDTKCFWSEEVAERLVNDDGQDTEA